MEKEEQQDLLKEEEVLLKKEYSSEFDSASAFFFMYSKYFEKMVAALSTGQLRRLSNALTMSPLSDKEFITSTDQSLKDAFAIGERLIQCKFLMIQERIVNATKQKDGENEDGTQA